ncbi:hypothetical protein BDZ88DRAFT_392935, partial [Geranomyces variabilis]
KCTREGCDKAFNQSPRLTTHIRRYHTGERPYKCTWKGCDSAFTSSGHLTDHRGFPTFVHWLYKHTGERPYKCAWPGCDATFSKNSVLTKHHIASFHTGERPHKCTWPGCDAEYSEKANLTKHVDSVHKGIRHTCDLCGTTFTTKNALSIHLRNKICRSAVK